MIDRDKQPISPNHASWTGVDTARPLVVRSNPPQAQNYNEYKENLRYDFFHMCAYCTMMEAEAAAVRFTIDHYEPTSARPDLENDYNNLMYACDPCNTRKGDRYPPPAARAQGVRFFRPDEDVHSDHFVLTGIRLSGKSKTGEYTVEALDLNRYMLNKLREIRSRSTAAESYVTEGIAALRRFPLDRLPQQLKGRVHTAIQGITKDAVATAKKVDEILRGEAKSPLIDKDPDDDHDVREKERKERLKALESFFGGNWRGRNEGVKT